MFQYLYEINTKTLIILIITNISTLNTNKKNSKIIQYTLSSNKRTFFYK